MGPGWATPRVHTPSAGMTQGWSLRDGVVLHYPRPPAPQGTCLGAPPGPSSVYLDCSPGAKVMQACSWLDIWTVSGRHRDCWVGGGWLICALHLEQWVRTAAYGWISTACLAGYLPVPVRASSPSEAAAASGGPRADQGIEGTAGPRSAPAGPCHWCGPPGLGTEVGCTRSTPRAAKEARCAGSTWVTGVVLPGPIPTHLPPQATAGTTSHLLPNRG